MAFVARNDPHGNEVMRVVLSTDPGKLTVASCHNLRINCEDQDPLFECDGRYDHRQRFHYYARGSKSQRCLGDKSQSVVEPIAQQKLEKERKRAQQLLWEKQSHSDDESAAWNTAEINAHSTFLSSGKLPDTTSQGHVNSPNFNSWLAEKNKSQQQQAEDRRLMAQQKDQRAEERAQLAHQKYQNWLRSKDSKLRRGKSDLSSMQTSTTSRQSLAPEEAQRLRQDWEKEKLKAIKAKREKHKAKEEKQQLMESARRELSAEAWEQWLDASKSKPRPVPMGKGLDSLRGSMAPLYTNPHEWQPVLGNDKRNSQSQASARLHLSAQIKQSKQVENDKKLGKNFYRRSSVARLEKSCIETGAVPKNGSLAVLSSQTQSKQSKQEENVKALGNMSYRRSSVARQETNRVETKAVPQDGVVLAVPKDGLLVVPKLSVQPRSKKWKEEENAKASGNMSYRRSSVARQEKSRIETGAVPKNGLLAVPQLSLQTRSKQCKAEKNDLSEKSFRRSSVAIQEKSSIETDAVPQVGLVVGFQGGVLGVPQDGLLKERSKQCKEEKNTKEKSFRCDSVAIQKKSPIETDAVPQDGLIVGVLGVPKDGLLAERSKQWKEEENAKEFGNKFYRGGSVDRQEKSRIKTEAVPPKGLLVRSQSELLEVPQDNLLAVAHVHHDSVGSISDITEIATVDQMEKLDQQKDYFDPSEPCEKSLIWSKNNARRVHELREIITPFDATKSAPLRYDQLEQLRRHQHLQNSKVLTPKFQEKREQLRETLKSWVTEGILDEAYCREDRNFEKTPTKNISQLEKNNNKNNETNAQCSKDQKQLIAKKIGISEIRTKSTDRPRSVKFKEPKGSAKTTRPWR